MLRFPERPSKRGRSLVLVLLGEETKRGGNCSDEPL